MHLLGDIDRLEPGREGAHQVARERRRAAAHQRLQLRPRAGLAAAGADRRHAIGLDQLEQRLAALLEQNLAHQRAQGVHVIAQRLVLGGEMDVAAIEHLVVPGVALGDAAARRDHAEALAGGGLHHLPVAHRAHAARA